MLFLKLWWLRWINLFLATFMVKHCKQEQKFCPSKKLSFRELSGRLLVEIDCELTIYCFHWIKNKLHVRNKLKKTVLQKKYHIWRNYLRKWVERIHLINGRSECLGLKSWAFGVDILVVKVKRTKDGGEDICLILFYLRSFTILQY